MLRDVQIAGAISEAATSTSASVGVLLPKHAVAAVE